MKEDNIGFICIPRTTDDKIYQKYNKCHPKCKGSTFNICITKKTGLQSVFLGSIISVVGKTTVEIMELFECRQKVP